MRSASDQLIDDYPRPLGYCHLLKLPLHNADLPVHRAELKGGYDRVGYGGKVAQGRERREQSHSDPGSIPPRPTRAAALAGLGAVALLFDFLLATNLAVTEQSDAFWWLGCVGILCTGVMLIALGIHAWLPNVYS